MREKNNEGPGRQKAYFGPGVIGPELYADEQAEAKADTLIFGPGVVGLPAGPVNKPGPGVTGQPAADDQKADVPSLSIEKLEEALDNNPALVDTFLPAELARAAGPRKGALVALEIAEELREGGPREEVVVQIRGAIEALGGKAPAPVASPAELGDPTEE